MDNIWLIAEFEYKKLLKRKIVWISAGITMFFCFFMAFSGLLGDSYVEGELYESHYQGTMLNIKYSRALSGRLLDQELLDEMYGAFDSVPDSEEHMWGTEYYQKHARPYEPIENCIWGMVGSDVGRVSQEQLYGIRKKLVEQEWETEHLTEGEKEYLKKQEENLEIPFTYQYSESYAQITEMMNTLTVLLTLVLAICVPGIFAEEHSRRTDQLILCTRYGKKVLYRAKVMVALSFSLALVCAMCLFLLIPVFGLYGADGFGAQIQLHMVKASWNLSMGQAMLIIIGLSAAAVLFECTICIFLAEYSGSSVTTMAIMVAGMFLALLIHIPEQYRTLSQIWDCNPISITAVWGAFSTRMVHLFGRYWTAWQVVPAAYLMIGILFLQIAGYRYRNYQVGAKGR